MLLRVTVQRQEKHLFSFFVIVTNTREKQLKVGKIYFGSQFQRFRSRVGLLHQDGSVVRQKVMVARGCGRA
jgi:hypothetical protein